MTIELYQTIQYEETQCCNCGINFAIPRAVYKQLRESKKTFYCPNGHDLAFVESENDRLKRQLVEERAKKEMAEAALKREIIAKEKLEKRVKFGICPYCKRYFKQVQAHMKCKHPEKK